MTRIRTEYVQNVMDRLGSGTETTLKGLVPPVEAQRLFGLCVTALDSDRLLPAHRERLMRYLGKSWLTIAEGEEIIAAHRSTERRTHLLRDRRLMRLRKALS